MKTILIYGNCHVYSLSNVLRSSPLFNNLYQIKSVIVHEASPEELENMFTQLAPSSDAVIYQPISKGFRNLNIGSDRFDAIDAIDGPTKIKLTNAYYQGYFPDVGYLYSGGKHIEFNKISVQDNSFFNRWMWKIGGVKNKHIEKYAGEILPIYNVNFYKKDWSLQEHHLSLAKLDWREDLFNADVRVTDFIRRNYRKKKLFHTINHPTINLFHEQGRQIMEILDLDPNTLAPAEKIKDPMNFTTFPVYPSTKQNLGISFEEPLEYKYNNIVYTPEAMETLLCDFYLNMIGKDRDDNLLRLTTNKIFF